MCDINIEGVIDMNVDDIIERIKEEEMMCEYCKIR